MMTLYFRTFKSASTIRPSKMLNKPMFKALLFSLLVMFSVNSYAAESSATYFSSASFLELDWDQKDQQDNYTFDGQWLYGSDYNILAILAEVEFIGNDTEEAEVQLLYSKYLATFWDLRFGLRQEFKPESETSLVIGIEGLAPYWFDVGSSLYISENGNVSAEMELAYEIQLSQKIVMELYTNATFNGYSDQNDNIGEGLAMADYGMQVRYEFNRHFAVYFDLNESKAYGDSKKYLQASGNESSESVFRLGVKIFNF